MQAAKRNVPAPDAIRLGSLLWIVVFIGIFATTGITFAFIKNSEITLIQQIAELNEEIFMFENDTNVAEMKINEYLGHFEIKAKLASQNSKLVQISNNQLEIIQESQLRRDAGLAATRAPSIK